MSDLSESHGLLYRPGTYDSKIIEEAMTSYNKMHLDKSDIVLDLGAHIGGYTCYISKKVGQVISYEADPINFELLKKNTSSLNNVKIFNRVVWKNNSEKISLFRVIKPFRDTLNTGMTSVYPKRGREEIKNKTVSFQDILDKYKPSKIKCDIEGAELDIFDDPLVIPFRVREIIMEVHLKDKPLKDRYQHMEDFIVKSGFTKIQKRKTMFVTDTWITVVHFKKLGLFE